MKKNALLITLLLSPAMLGAVTLNLGIDMFSLDSLINNNIALRGEAGLLLDDIKISSTIGYYQSFERDCQVCAINSSLDFDYFPFSNLGLYLGASLINNTYLFGIDAPSDNSIFLTSIRCGYNLPILKYCSIDLRAALFDSSISEKGITIDQLSRYRFSLIFSWQSEFK